MKYLNPKNAHGCDSIWTKMMLICGWTVTVPWKNMNQHKKKNFQKHEKIVNVVPVHKQGNISIY